MAIAPYSVRFSDPSRIGSALADVLEMLFLSHWNAHEDERTEGLRTFVELRRVALTGRTRGLPSPLRWFAARHDLNRQTLDRLTRGELSRVGMDTWEALEALVESADSAWRRDRDNLVRIARCGPWSNLRRYKTSWPWFAEDERELKRRVLYAITCEHALVAWQNSVDACVQLPDALALTVGRLHSERVRTKVRAQRRSAARHR